MRVFQGLWVSCLLVPLLWGAPAAAQSTVLIQNTYEDGTVQGWGGRGGVEVLTASTEAARNGSYGLKVSGRTQSWHGPTLNVTASMEPGATYLFSGWVRLPAGSPNTTVSMTMQRTMPDTVRYEQLASATASSAGWVKLEAHYRLQEAATNLSVYFEIPSNSGLGLHLDDFQMERIRIEENIPSLKTVFSGDFLMGVSFDNHELLGSVDKQLMARHFNSVTPGNVLKWDSTEPQEGVYDLADSDAAIQFALDNGQQVRGHTLVWHNQTPDWVYRDASGNLASKELLYQRMESHIKTVVGRYKDSIYAWDVVNEVIDASQPDGLRRSLWYQIAGEEYIEKAFRFAREADPDARLFINDYNTHEPAKSQALYNLVQRLKAKGVPIDGVGHQTHIRISYPSMSEIENSIIKFAGLGVDQHITELDISVYSDDTSRYDTFPPALKEQQAARYKQLFDIFKKHKSLVTNVTLWGKDDGNTWLRSFPIVRNDWPLLFDERLQSKPAYWAIVNASVPQVPAAPVGLVATAGHGQVALTWTASNGATGYNVKRSTASGGPYAAVATGLAATGFTDTGLTNGTTYYYVVSATNGAGESVNSAQVSAVPQAPLPPSQLVLQYRSGDATASDNQLKPHFNIRNLGATAVRLSELKIRYYFTRDGSQSLNSWVDWAQVGSSHVQRTFVSATGANTDTYLELSFAEGAGTLQAGGQSGDIHVRIAKSDWSNFNESNDYSFDPTKTSYSDWTRVTLYHNGTRVWGIEP